MGFEPQARPMESEIPFNGQQASNGRIGSRTKSFIEAPEIITGPDGGDTTLDSF